MKYQEQIDEIMDWFDFDKVHETMTKLNWTWRDEGVPKVQELRAAARRHLREVANNGDDYWGSACGGFRAERHEDMLRLMFIVSEWEAYTEEQE